MAPPPSGAEQRRHYRIASGLDTLLAAALVLADGTAVAAQLLDVSAGGVGLRWDASDTPVLDLGEPVRLRFQPQPAGRPVEIEAAVRWMGLDEGGVRYGFEFTGLDKVAAELDPRLWTLFNRRATPR